MTFAMTMKIKYEFCLIYFENHAFSCLYCTVYRKIFVLGNFGKNDAWKVC